ncbi:MAG: S8 family peptidase [Anaerolineae bacterium]|nr:S8 family peptidase [Anaerolineae bacterium]
MRTRTQFLASIVLVVMLFGFGLAPEPAPAVSVIVCGPSVEAAVAAVVQHGGRVTRALAVIEGVAAEVPQTMLAALATTRGVTSVFPNQAVTAAGYGVADVEFPIVVGADKVWELGNLGEGVTVAVLDTGADTTLLGLRRDADRNRDRILVYYDALGGGLYEYPFIHWSPRDPNGHGTHVSGIICNSEYEFMDNQYRGIAPNADLVLVRVLDEYGAGTYADVIAGIDWAVQHKDDYNIRVLNISMYAPPVAPYWADPYNLAVMAAWQAGIVVVASAGNDGPAPMSIGVPGNTPYVITVGSFTDNFTPEYFGDDYMPPFSATGPTLDAFVKPDIIAPGAHIVSLLRGNTYLAQTYPENRLNGRYFKTSGTSTSSAVVSGIAALMLSENPDLTPDEVKYRLTVTARPQFSEYSGEAAYSIWEQGAGRVWAPDAVYATVEGTANAGMDLVADLAGTVHYQGWTVYDPDTETFVIQGTGYETWAGGYETWAGGYETWAGGYETWAGGTTNWSGDFNDWLAAYETWAGGGNAWAGGYETWAGGYETWAGGYETWAGGYETWAGGYSTWAGGYETWAGGYETWAGSTGDPIWAANYVNLLNLPTDATAVGFNLLFWEE